MYKMLYSLVLVAVCAIHLSSAAITDVKLRIKDNKQDPKNRELEVTCEYKAEKDDEPVTVKIFMKDVAEPLFLQKTNTKPEVTAIPGKIDKLEHADSTNNTNPTFKIVNQPKPEGIFSCKLSDKSTQEKASSLDVQVYSAPETVKFNIETLRKDAKEKQVFESDDELEASCEYSLPDGGETLKSLDFMRNETVFYTYPDKKNTDIDGIKGDQLELISKEGDKNIKLKIKKSEEKTQGKFSCKISVEDPHTQDPDKKDKVNLFKSVPSETVELKYNSAAGQLASLTMLIAAFLTYMRLGY